MIWLEKYVEDKKGCFNVKLDSEYKFNYASSTTTMWLDNQKKEGSSIIKKVKNIDDLSKKAF